MAFLVAVVARTYVSREMGRLQPLDGCMRLGNLNGVICNSLN